MLKRQLAILVLFSAQPLLAQQSLDSTLLKSFRWRAAGPDRGGRSIAVSGVRGRPKEAYFGAVGGGLWKSLDGGDTWAPVTDGQLGSASVGAVAVSESNPDIVYIGMGESCIRGNILPGDGVYKSTDAGKTWTHIGFASSENISKIRIDPRNPDIVYVAAFGKHSAPNPDRGVYKSTDGGKTWRKVLYRDAKTAAIDLSIDRTNPNVLYAALWEAYRNEYTMSSGGPGSGLFKSTDGGETWTEITRNKGLPVGIDGRIGVAVSGANPNRVYALVENQNGGLFRSDDAGATWTVVNQERAIRQRAFYYTHLYASPANADVVYVQNTALFKSTDGGKTTKQLAGTHGDHHDLWLDPADSLHLIDGNDGGGAISFNGGLSWTDEDYPTEQFYHIAATADLPYHICGAQQDNSTLCVPAKWNANVPQRFGGGRREPPPLPPGAVPEPTHNGMAVAYQVAGGEPGYIAPDPKDPDVFFSGTNNGGYIDRYNRHTRQQREVNPYPWFYSGEPSSEIPERWQWTFPIIFSPVDRNVLYTSSQRVWKTTNGGQNWVAISGDLTRHDPKTMGHSGGPITGDMNGPEVYAVVFALGPSKQDVNVLWAGSDDGLVHVTRDGGQSWTNVTPKDMPAYGRVTQIDASSFDVGSAYISVKRPLLDDKAPYIFKTSDFGKTWTKIVNGIAPTAWVNAVREDPKRKGMLYAGTNHGVYLSYDDGTSWLPLSLNLPDVPVADLIVQGNDVAIATHGRGFYVLDDMNALREYSPELVASSARLFAPPPAVRSAGPVTVTYWLKDAAKQVNVDVLDSEGKVIRSFTSDTTVRAEGARPPIAAGVQRLAWDLRYNPASSFPGMILWGASVAGPVAPPGNYQVRLTVDGQDRGVQPISLVRNPMFPEVSDADLRAQFALALQIRDRVSDANNAVIRIRDIKKQVADLVKKDSTNASLKQAADTLSARLSAVEGEIYQVKNQSNQDPLNFPIKVNNRLANLLRIVDDGDGAPIANAPVLFQEYSKQLQTLLERLRNVLCSDLGPVNNELQKKGLQPISGGTCVS